MYYEELSDKLKARMERERAEGTFCSFAFSDRAAVRRNDNPHDRATIWRPAFVRDIDKIMNCPYYNRYADKTQVFSFYRNDDITRRGQHVQYVSRIARTIGAALHLNGDLIEAIALGHDIGHTPFGHAGERFLSELYHARTGRYFSHNIHSVRVLDILFPLNISLQTLSGIASHDGELELSEYKPKPLSGFREFDAQIEACYCDAANVKKLVPCTLEGCAVRISDIIAYLGKDRQDAQRVKLLKGEEFAAGAIGSINAEIVNNLTVNIIENSYGKGYVKLDETHFAALRRAKQEDYDLIYRNEKVERELNENVRPMAEELYEKLLRDLNEGRTNSPVFRHHIAYLDQPYYSRKRSMPYEETERNQIVVDYIASMTDDYFVDLYEYLFPHGKYKIRFKTYFG
ncbi:MAG: HD domain-containing protein [Clostridia bacterium]|jgi:dGTPase|nr:HD domain-containing protein [Clostridia bacterium]